VGSYGRAVAVVAVVSALAGGAAITPDRGGALGTLLPHPRTRTAALTVLADLPVRGRAARTGYTRARFGEAWADTDHNGCDTRDDVLRRDLRDAVVADDGCTVLGGTLTDPYTGTLVRYPAVPLQVDHVVPLGDAWVTGAQRLGSARRTALANDPLNLVTTTARITVRKSGGDASSWLPPSQAFRCAYVARQIAVKQAYGLWVTAPERAAMTTVLADCPGEPVPTSQDTTTPGRDGAPAGASTDEPWTGPTAPNAPDPTDVEPNAGSADGGSTDTGPTDALPTAALPTAALPTDAEPNAGPAPEAVVTVPRATPRTTPRRTVVPRRTTPARRVPSPSAVPLG